MPTMIDRYLYLLLSLGLCAIAFICVALRPDLRKPAFLAAVFGAVAGPVAQLWYLRDYWRPQTLLGTGSLSLEDVLAGVGVAVAGVLLYKVVFRVSFRTNAFPRRVRLLLFLLAGSTLLLALLPPWGFNSAYVSMMQFLLVTLVMVIIRHDLAIPAFMSGLLLALASIPVYFVLFTYLDPSYANQYWLLHVFQVGNIPITEPLWYLTFGMLAGIAYEFAAGRALVRAESVLRRTL